MFATGAPSESRHFDLKLWRYNYEIGVWEEVRTCTKQSALVWLAAYSLEEPDVHYRIGKKRPSFNPNAPHRQDD